MNFQEDYTQAKRRQDLLRSMFQQNLQPQRRPGLASTLGRALAAYMMSKDMGKADSQMSQAAQGQQDSRKMDMANVLSAYRQDTPYQMDSSELFPGEPPIAGLKNMGTGQDRNAMVQAMMATNDPNIQNRGMDAMLSPQQKAGRVPASIQEYEYLNQLSEVDQKRFMEVKRSPGAKVLDLKDKFRVIDGTGNLIGEFDKGIAKTDTADFKSGVAGAEEQAKQQEKSKFKRWNVQMDEGLQAADGLPILGRSLSLLRSGVETGGIDALKLKS